MGRSKYDMVRVTEEQKEVLKNTVEFVHDRDGHKPSQGEVVEMGCKALQEAEA